MARRRLIASLLSLCICAVLSGAIAAAPKDAQRDEVMWQPGESYQGGSQYDARLDKPVHFWRAGAPLRDIFTELTSQTGVAFDFLAPDADEPRLCVTLYLNPDKPPSLRDVMAQLIWVTGCSFSYSDATSQSGEATPLRSTSIPDKGLTYHLLWSSVGQGAAEKLAAETAARREQFAAEQQAQRDAQRERTTNLLQEERAALALSDADAIARYRGVNDALLLNLLDPTRRAGLSLLSSLSEDDTNTMLNGQGRMPMLSREWSAWSPDQQAALKQALGMDQLPKEGQVSVVVGGGRGGMLMAVVQTDQGPQVLGRARGLLASGGLRPRQEAQLRGYLGEAEPAQPAAGGGGQPAAGGGQAAAQQGPANRGQQRAQQREQWLQAREEAMAQARALSPEAEQLLAGVTLPGADAGGSLWQVQEAVAKATGMDVVSDCFSPPRPGFFPRGQQAPDTVAALDALSQAGAAFGPGFGGGPRGFGGGPPGPGGGGAGDDLGQQWGDAGAFLRFRAQRPDIWRGAMLPSDVQAQLDTWLKPFVAAASESPGPASSPLAGDVEKTSWLASHLNDLQIQLGGAIPYEDPSDATGARLQTLRRATLQRIGFGLPLYRLLGSLTAKQWARLRGDGLQWGKDLTPDQQSSDVSGMLGRGVPQDRVADVVIKLGQTQERTVQGRGGGSRTIPSVPALEFVLDGTAVNEIPLSGGWGFGPGGGGGRGGGGRGGGGFRGGGGGGGG